METKSIEKEILLSANVATVWQKWTTNKGIQSFFAADCKVELKIGGDFEMYFIADAEPGGKGSEGCKILSYLPQKMLSFSWNAPPQFPSIRNQGPSTWVVLEMEAVNQSQTHLRLTHLGWQAGEEWQKVYDYFNKAWGSVLVWLKESVEV